MLGVIFLVRILKKNITCKIQCRLNKLTTKNNLITVTVLVALGLDVTKIYTKLKSDETGFWINDVFALLIFLFIF